MTYNAIKTFQFNFYFPCTFKYMRIKQKASYMLKCEKKLKEYNKLVTYILNLFSVSPVTRYVSQLSDTGVGIRAIRKSGQHAVFNPSSLNYGSKKAPFLTLLQERHGKICKTDTMREKKTFQNPAGQALEATLPLVTAQTPHAAASRVAEVTAERMGNLPLEGRKR